MWRKTVCATSTCLSFLVSRGPRSERSKLPPTVSPTKCKSADEDGLQSTSPWMSLIKCTAITKAMITKPDGPTLKAMDLPPKWLAPKWLWVWRAECPRCNVWRAETFLHAHPCDVPH